MVAIWTLAALSCSSEPKPGTFIPPQIAIEEVAGSDFKRLLNDNLMFVDSSGVEWVAPKGAWTDGASVPRAVLWVTDGRFASEFLKAAVVHDAYCQKENETRCPKQYRTRPWRQVHRMFYEACIAGGTPSWLAKIMFAAVYLAGPTWDDPDADLSQVSDAALAIGFGGAKHWIEENDPPIEEIEADLQHRKEVLLERQQLQSTVVAALDAGNWGQATEALQQQKLVLDRELRQSPDDLMLLNFQAGLNESWAAVSLAAGRSDSTEAHIAAAASAFEGVIVLDAENPHALYGLARLSDYQGSEAQADRFRVAAMSASKGIDSVRLGQVLIEDQRLMIAPERLQRIEGREDPR